MEMGLLARARGVQGRAVMVPTIKFFGVIISPSPTPPRSFVFSPSLHTVTRFVSFYIFCGGGGEETHESMDRDAIRGANLRDLRPDRSGPSRPTIARRCTFARSSFKIAPDIFAPFVRGSCARGSLLLIASDFILYLATSVILIARNYLCRLIIMISRRSGDGRLSEIEISSRNYKLLLIRARAVYPLKTIYAFTSAIYYGERARRRGRAIKFVDSRS